VPVVIEAVWQSDSLPARFLRTCLEPLSMLFAAVVALRNALFDHGLLRVLRVAVPVVSVGNLRVGGTGKTPFVIWLVERLQGRSLRVVVVSRGYGADPQPTLICSRVQAERVPFGVGSRRVVTEDAHDGPLVAADEALLVALRTGACVVTGADRHAACTLAAQACAPDLIVIDDGFQHRRLGREVDVVLLAPDDRGARLLPVGPLREGVNALRRADIVIESAPAPGRFRVRRRAVGLVRTVQRDAAVESLDLLRGASITAVSALASNDGFFSMLSTLGARLTSGLGFPDHHRYDAGDWRRISTEAESSRWIVTTEKDLVKLAPVAHADPRLRAVRLELEVEGGEEIVDLICARTRLDPRRRGQHDRGPRPQGIEA
jgi:tetraacyldisaccharide 4'-kinase